MTESWSGGDAGGEPEPVGGNAYRSGRRRAGPSSGGSRGARSRGPAGNAPDDDGPATPTDDRDPGEVARGICLRALTGASKTRQQLAELLARREIPDAVAETVLDRFTEVGLIDDAAFAAAWVTSRQTGRGLARRALAQELRAKGVDGEVAAAAVAEIDPQDEWDAARRLVDRKARSMARLDRVTAERRLVGMLARNGYGGGLAAIVAREALDALAAEGDGYDGPDGGAVVEQEPDDGSASGGGLTGTDRRHRPVGMADEVGEGHWVGIGRFPGPDDRLR